ncbi:hypothetical protein [Ferroacidibacillus organovorans]|uniref:Uncharacterized protein n=1 Tax=Ferroacidibacillus organovorans TaxID=1765683 RepID=A0A117SXS5_9BACL|nr:hypothetical protein [Ferroacidibacillus organovorans]KUO95898.1 hypothetical protein ATW55_09210 [Ferroacidibacillus organovorans]
MFIIQCSKCNRTVEWKTGSQVGHMEIEVSGSAVICACGLGIAEDAGHDALREFNVPPGNRYDDDPLDPRDYFTQEEEQYPITL